MIEAEAFKADSEYLGTLRISEEGAALRVLWRRDGGAPEVFIDAAMIEKLPPEIRAVYDGA